MTGRGSEIDYLKARMKLVEVWRVRFDYLKADKRLVIVIVIVIVILTLQYKEQRKHTIHNKRLRETDFKE